MIKKKKNEEGKVVIYLCLCVRAEKRWLVNRREERPIVLRQNKISQQLTLRIASKRRFADDLANEAVDRENRHR